MYPWRPRAAGSSVESSIPARFYHSAIPPREIPILGVGSVSLPLKSYAGSSGSATLVLEDVLHVRDADTSVICATMLMGTHQINTPLRQPDDAWVRDRTSGHRLGIFELLGKGGEVPKLRLKGQKPGDASFPKNATLENLAVAWPPWEVKKCQEKLRRPAK